MLAYGIAMKFYCAFRDWWILQLLFLCLKSLRVGRGERHTVILAVQTGLGNLSILVISDSSESVKLIWSWPVGITLRTYAPKHSIVDIETATKVWIAWFTFEFQLVFFGSSDIGLIKDEIRRLLLVDQERPLSRFTRLLGYGSRC